MAVALYWVLLQTELVSISDVLWFSVDKLGYLCTNILVLCIPGGPDILYYSLQTVLYNSVLCAQHSSEHLCTQGVQQFIIKTVWCKFILKWQYIIPVTSQMSYCMKVQSAILQFSHGLRLTKQCY